MPRDLGPEESIAAVAASLGRAGIATQAIGGRVGFRVHGPGGGDWIVDLGQPGGEWSRPLDASGVASCDVTLYAEAEAMSHLVLQPELVDTDLKSGVLQIEGERDRLVRLGRGVAPEGTAA